jgi:hypothetical protein
MTLRFLQVLENSKCDKSIPTFPENSIVKPNKKGLSNILKALFWN